MVLLGEAGRPRAVRGWADLLNRVSEQTVRRADIDVNDLLRRPGRVLVAVLAKGVENCDDAPPCGRVVKYAARQENNRFSKGGP